MYKFLIVDDHTIVREGYKIIIKTKFSDAIIHEAGSSSDSKPLLKENDYDLVILDMSIPGSDGFEILEFVKQNYPKTNVLVSTMHDEKIYATKSLELGASGFICKDSSHEELNLAISSILNGGRYLSRKMSDKLAFGDKSGDLDSLSKRELQVLRFLAQGLLAKQIADDLNLSVKTINTYSSRILEKLGLSSTPEMINYAIKHKIV